jgi:RAD50-interacting protein 1
MLHLASMYFRCVQKRVLLTYFNRVLEDESGLSQTLLPSISLLSSHLSYLRSSLPVVTVTVLYRRITSRIAEHIAQRSVLYRGRGQLSPKDGEVLLTEALLWVQSCQTALGISTDKAQAPWIQLLEVVKVVALQGEPWEKVENATFDEKIGDTEWHDTLAEIVDVTETSRDDIRRALRAREDCEY